MSGLGLGVYGFWFGVRFFFAGAMLGEECMAVDVWENREKGYFFSLNCSAEKEELERKALSFLFFSFLFFSLLFFSSIKY